MSEQETVSIGSVGALKSGGPQMTLTEMLNSGHKALFSWIKDDGVLSEGYFPVACIKFSHPKPEQPKREAPNPIGYSLP